MKKAIRDIVLVALISVLGLVVIEMVVRVFWPQNRESIYEGASLGMRDPVLNHVLRPRAKAISISPEFSVRYEINAGGLRDRSPHPIPKGSSMTRILVLGDSFTFGDANHYQDIWPVVVEKELTNRGYNVDVVKAGVPGYDTTAEVLYMFRLFDRYQPDIIVIAFLPNDLFSNRSLDSTELMKSRQEELGVTGGALSKKNLLHIVTLLQRILLSIDGVYVRVYTSTARGQFYRACPSKRATQSIETTKAILAEAHYFCRKKQRPLIVLSIPQLFQVVWAANGYKDKAIDVHRIDKTFQSFADLGNFFWFPVLPVLANAYASGKAPLYFRHDGHLTCQGNHLVGLYLAARLADTGVLKERIMPIVGSIRKDQF